MVQQKQIPLGTMRTHIRSQAPLSGLRIRCCCGCGVGRSQGLDLALLWLWCRPAATAQIRPLALEPPYALGAALKRQKEKKKYALYEGFLY